MNFTKKIRDGSRESFLGWMGIFLGISIIVGNLLAGLVGALLLVRSDRLERFRRSPVQPSEQSL